MNQIPMPTLRISLKNLAILAIENSGNKKGPNLPVCLFLFLEIQIEIEKSGVKHLKLDVCMYVEKRWLQNFLWFYL